MKEAVEPEMLRAGRGRVRVMWMDEARIGQQGTLTDVWALRGSRPTAVKQTRYQWVYLFAAVEPATGFSSALLAPNVNTGTMNAFLGVLASEIDPGDCVVLIMDQAGWHKARALKVPDAIVILYLPPYSPELNPAENLWHHLRSQYLSNRSYEDYDALLDAGTQAWRELTSEVIQSVCACRVRPITRPLRCGRTVTSERDTVTREGHGSVARSARA